MLATTGIVLSIFVWKLFPECFVEGTGLTPFKKYSEYIICMILAVSIWLLNKNRKRFDPGIYKVLFGSLVCTIISELAFYVSNYGASNLVGHYFKLFSFYLIYKAIIETGIRQPYGLIFKELNTTNKNLSNEIHARIKIEKYIHDHSEAKFSHGICPECIKKFYPDQLT